MEGSILRGIGSFYTVLCEADGQEYTLRAQKKLRHQRLTPMVGDRVRFTPGEGEEDGWLEEILPRKSMLVRPSVANVDMLMLVMASVPAPDLMLCDKLILRANAGNMTPAICVNKIDLGEELAQKIREEYAGTQLRVFAVSAQSGEGVEQLREAMRGRVTCLAGQSAVGKSSLLNRLFGLELETGGLSRKTERGKLTTRHVELFAIDDSKDSGYIADTPGFTMLDFAEFNFFTKDDLPHTMRDFERYYGKCRYTKCSHTKEDGCAVLEALSRGEIAKSRHDSFLAMYETLKNKPTWEKSQEKRK